MKKTIVGVWVIALVLFPQLADAQCAMCRAVLESDGNTATAEGINNGIVYLMAIPYVAIAVLFYFVFKKMKPKTPQNV
ncbi:MAG: hypothetical protein WBG48_10705 [Pricia sp.]